MSCFFNTEIFRMYLSNLIRINFPSHQPLLWYRLCFLCHNRIRTFINISYKYIMSDITISTLLIRYRIWILTVEYQHYTNSLSVALVRGPYKCNFFRGNACLPNEDNHKCWHMRMVQVWYRYVFVLEIVRTNRFLIYIVTTGFRSEEHQIKSYRQCAYYRFTHNTHFMVRSSMFVWETRRSV